jgi:CRP-like cAMP-binding protein
MEEELRLDLVRFQREACIVLAEDKRVADRFFIIREGNVRLYKEVQVQGEEQAEILGPGDFFDVISAMSGHSHIETAIAVTGVVLVAVRPWQFGQLIQNKTPVAKNILIQFSKKMRHLNESLAALTLKEESPPDVKRLYFVAEHYYKEYQYKQACYAYSKYIKYCPEGKNIQKAQDHLKKAASNVKNYNPDAETNEASRTYQKDDMIFAEGEPAGEIFIIRKGSVKITRVSNNCEILLAILKIGDIFGEMALLESKPRGASALAHEDCELMVVNRANFDEMIKTQTQLITKLTTLLAERIWTSYRQLANAQMSDPLRRMYDMLLIQLEKRRINLDGKGSYAFDFGPKELLNMIGISYELGGEALNKFLQSHFLKITQDKIIVQDVFEFSKHVSFYRKKMEVEKERLEKEHK